MNVTKESRCSISEKPSVLHNDLLQEKLHAADEANYAEPRLSTMLEKLSLSERQAEAWQRSIEHAVRSVVSIRFCQPYSFDTTLSMVSEATGFVVDDEKGYVLTNRHVVGGGPFWGSIIFHNHEEVDAFPLYRDPIHDFGLLRFSRTALKHTQPRSLRLRPDLAQVGTEIRVIGNDAGERLSIVSGFISRVDRNAPKYKGYQDFNACYYQSSAPNAGGSSGSPVINIDGYAIAMHAGGRDSASTKYMLSLDGPLRALRLMQQGRAVVRGDIQCKFLLKPFNECRRLGLDPGLEEAVREAFPQDNNMLVAETVLPEGPADNKIREGDILVKISGELVTKFVRFDDMLDSNVGRSVRFLLQRGGKSFEVDIIIGDLGKTMPDRFLAVAGASFHDLSYQVAQRYAIACKGVYICECASLGFSKRNEWLLQTIDQKEVPNLRTLAEIMMRLPDKARVAFTYKDVSDLHTLKTSMVTINRHWYSKMKMVIMNDTTGLCDFEILADRLPPTPPVPCKASFDQLQRIPHRAVADIVRSFIRVDCTAPFSAEGSGYGVERGMGLVLDADKGLVLVSRSVVPHALCDIALTIADSILVEGKVIFLHPFQNYSIVQYDPNLVDAPVLSAVLSLDLISQGASTLFVGYTDDCRMVYASTVVTETTATAIPPANVPRYRPMNMKEIRVDTKLGTKCGSGVLMTTDGNVQAVWLRHKGKSDCYHFGLATTALLPVISHIRGGVTPKLRILPTEFETISMFQARVMGVGNEWIEKVEESTWRNQLFMVKRAFAIPVAQLLEGDILLTLNGKIITDASELDVMYWHEFLDAVIVRSGQQLTLRVDTIASGGMETDYVANVCGAIVHKPHLAVRQQVKKLPSEVYVASRFYGSPSNHYDLSTTRFITHVNDIATPSVNTFVSVVQEIADDTYFQVRGISYDCIPFVTTMKKSERYSPTMEWLKDPSEPDGWCRRVYEDGKVIEGEGTYGVWF